MPVPQTMYVGSDVYINNIPLNSIDQYGCKWILTDLDGWWGLPEPSVPDDSRPFHEDGSYYTAGRYGPRVITVTGHIVPDGHNPHSAVEARNALNRALNMVRSAGILRVEEGPSKQARVQLVGRPLTRFNKANNDLEFNIQLRASDPRKYSTSALTVVTKLPSSESGRTYSRTYNRVYGASNSSGTLTINNMGSYSSFGTIQITGPINNPRVENVEQNAALEFNISLSAQETLDIDLQARTVKLNNTASRRHLMKPSSKWFTIAPGINTIRFNGIQTAEPREYTPARVNLVTQPVPAATTSLWQFTAGASETGGSTTSTNVTGPENRKSYYNRTVTVPKTAGSSGIYYRETSPALSGAAGATRTASMWVQFSHDVTVQPVMYFRSGATVVTSINGSTVTAQANTWTRVSVTGTSTAAFDGMQLSALLPASSVIPGGGYYRASAILIESQDTLYPYFDGGSFSASWTGTPNSSTSSVAELPAIPPSMIYLTYRSAWIE